MEKSKVHKDIRQEMARLRSLHDEAFSCIMEGLRCEESDQGSTALKMYLQGREMLLEALQIGVPEGKEFEAEQIMRAKMQKHLEELKGRISSLQREGPRNEAPPPYQEGVLRGAQPLGNLPRPPSMMTEEIFSIPSGVYLFQVSPEGRVSSPQPSTSLQVLCFIQSDTIAPINSATNTDVTGIVNTPPAFLQVGDWVCPLVADQTIVLKTSYGAYMFPDLENTNQEVPKFVGIILPSELSTEQRNAFEGLLGDLTIYREEPDVTEDESQPQRVPRSAPLTEDARFSHKLSGALVTGAGYLGQALNKGAEWTGYWVQQGARKLREQMAPEDKPIKVDPRLQAGLQVARGATGAARKCSGFLVGKLSDMTHALATQAAPHVRYYGNKLLIKSGFVEDTPDSANNNQVIDDICVVAAGGVQSFSVLYMSLEQAARQLASCLASETVQVVHHKYGIEASEVVDNAVSSLGNLALATNNIRSFGVKAIAKRTAKETGKAVLRDYVDEHPDKTNNNTNQNS